jgi:dihydrofolate reductase / thymidylate synthase
MFSKLRKNINVVVACTKDLGIAKNGKIPWNSPTDLKYFKNLTIQTEKIQSTGINTLIMGMNTFKTLKSPLFGRLNYVITTKANQYLNTENVEYFNSIEDAIKKADNNQSVEKIFIIGGETIYNQVLDNYINYIDTIYITFIIEKHKGEYICDKFLSNKLYNFIQDKSKTVIIPENILNPQLEMTEWRPPNISETAYLKLIENILINGEKRSTRTGVDVLSVFGEKLVFDISERIPFLTTKKLAWKTMLKELLWFISGSTDNNVLRNNGVFIWDGNASRTYLDSIGLVNRKENDLGPIYSHQWRHFGADYTDCEGNYSGKGIDQLKQVIWLLKNDPMSRRIILSAWNPAQLHLMALPPCHVLAQWYCHTDGKLDCQLYQRSADIGLGIPFNIASYSLLTYMLCHLTGYKPGKFIHIIGDAHIYVSHINQLKQQIERVPYQYPKLDFARKVVDIDDFKEEDFILLDYKCHPAIKMPMAV